MNNKQFITQLASKTGFSNDQTQQAVNTIVDTILATLTKGDSFTISNLGTFEVRKRMERILVNPTTKQRMLVPPKLVLAFKPQQNVKRQLKGGNKQ